MKRLAPILLSLVLPILAFSYEVNIKGIVVDGMLQGVAGIKIQVESPPNHLFQFSQMLETDPDGTFALTVSVPDSIPRGIFILTYEDCTGNVRARRLQYSVEQTDLSIRLEYCPGTPPEPECKVKIVPRHGDSALILKAVARGTPPFQFKWNTGDSTQTIRVSQPGEYCVEIVDSGGCTARDCIRVDFQNRCKTTIHAARFRQDSIMLFARSIGREPFSYMWSTGETTPAIWVTEPGEYCVKMVDAAGCISRDCIRIPDFSDSCSVKIERTGQGELVAKPRGTPPFTFMWSTGDTTRAIAIRGPGEYCVKIVDRTGCMARDCIRIPDFSDSCSVKIERAGQRELIAKPRGTPPFAFMWSTGDTTRAIAIRGPGEYCVKIVDRTGCMARDCIRIPDFSDSCSVKIERRGHGELVAIPWGTSPFTFMWSTGDTTRGIAIPGTGEYCVTIQDSEGCAARACVKIRDENDSCDVRIVAKRIDNTHIKLLARAKGRGEISYLWSTGSMEEAIVVSERGTYCVQIKDEGGCEARSCIEIPGTGPCSVRIRRGEDHVLTAVPSGAGPFEFSWSTGEVSQSIKAETSGEYCVKIMDSLGCMSSACIKVEIRGQNNVSDISGREDKHYSLTSVKMETIDAFPNPFTDRLNLSVQSDLTESSMIEVYRMDGTLIWKGHWALSKGYNEHQIRLDQIPGGMYYLLWKGQSSVHTIRILKQ